MRFVLLDASSTPGTKCVTSGAFQEEEEGRLHDAIQISDC